VHGELIPKKHRVVQGGIDAAHLKPPRVATSRYSANRSSCCPFSTASGNVSRFMALPGGDTEQDSPSMQQALGRTPLQIAGQPLCMPAPAVLAEQVIISKVPLRSER
jgi:hypothetical protein